MTDTLLKPDDTGEIRRDPGATTTNLTQYARHLPPMQALRMVDATGEIPRWYNADADGGCRTVVPNDEDFEPSQPIPHPDPLPPPPPPTPKVDDRPLSEGEEIVWDVAALHPRDMPAAYVGRHRKADDMPATVPAGRFGVLRSVLALAWARLSAAWSEK